MIYSDDKGETWHLGGIMDVDYTNESTVTELSNGDLMLNMRKQSDTENIGWSPPVRTADWTWTSCKYTTLKEPICQVPYSFTVWGMMVKALFCSRILTVRPIVIITR